MRERIEKLQNRLAEAGLEAILLKSGPNRRWCTGMHSTEGTVVVTRQAAWCLMDSRYFEAARQRVRALTVALVDREKPLKAHLAEILAGTQRLGVEDAYLSWADYLRYKDMVEAEVVGASALMAELRAAKDAAELAAIRRAQAITDQVFTEILAFIRPGLTERQVAAELTYRQMRLGAEGNSFDPIVVSGKKSSMPHGEPDGNIIQTGDFLTMDFGCVVDGYCSDMTRTVAIGSADGEMREIYELVLAAQAAGIQAARAGIPGADIDAAGRDVIESAGHGAHFGHSFGHSLGLEIHEGPNASPTEARCMPVGVISAEPGVYLPGKFGVRIEDILCLTEDGCIDLTKSPKNLIIL
jgi:Xaa-Pro aminopeptidase